MNLQKIKLAILHTAMVLYLCQSTSNLHPVILVPGSGGNQLEARLTSEYKASSCVCKWYPLVKQKGGWFRLWFDVSVLFSPFTKCFAERMMIYYDKEIDDYCNAPGVETRVPHFGSTRSLLFLNPHLKDITSYMSPLVESLEGIGYSDGQTLFGAPYDFRYGLGANGQPSKVGSKFLQDLKLLIEKASKINGDKSVIIVSHSLGGQFVLQFLNRNSLSWRQKFIKKFIALSAPWGGTVEEMRTFGSGNTFGVPLVNPLLVRGEQRSSESNLWLMPNPRIFGKTPLVITPNFTYTANDTPKFLIDIGFSSGVYSYKHRIMPLFEQLVAPHVPITCVIGVGVKTPERLIYRERGFDEQPNVEYGDGDGTVNLVSLLALESLWSGVDEQVLKVVRLDGVSHTSVLKDDKALDVIMREVSCINSDARISTLY